MRRDLSVRAVDLRELMDEPDADIDMLERTYERFRLVNALVSRPGVLYRRDIRPRAARGPVRVLDVGAGGGDVCRMIASRLRRDGLPGEITALDVDGRAIRWAAARDDGAGVRYRQAPVQELVSAGERFDVVFSNHVLHHLEASELKGMLRDTAALVGPGGLVVHRDISRSRSAYALYAAVTLPFARTILRDTFVREDGLLSIRRSYTPREIAEAAPGWSVRSGLPARLEIRWEG